MATVNAIFYGVDRGPDTDRRGRSVSRMQLDCSCKRTDSKQPEGQTWQLRNVRGAACGASSPPARDTLCSPPPSVDAVGPLPPSGLAPKAGQRQPHSGGRGGRAGEEGLEEVTTMGAQVPKQLQFHL